MRVIAGALKGRRLKTPTWEGLRPTSDKLRETLFNILASRIVGARVLDLCAGTGALGIEALSRGACDVTFVERDRRAQMLIAENLAHCGVTTGYTVVRADARRGLGRLGGGGYDVILLDPPYASGREDLELLLESAKALLAPDGLLVLEHARRMQAPEGVGRLAHVRDVTSGDSALSFYESPKGQ
jgi:16S rRNA (guanine(966)-N(2))-methyltransferase RsmD